MTIKNKVTVITGGNSGIGLGIASEFVNNGAFVVISGRNKETLQTAQEQLGDNTLAVQTDVANLADLDGLYEQTEERFGKIDVLVVNAGIAKFAPVNLADEAHFDAMFDINVKGAYFTVQKALPYLNDGASIILIASNAAGRGFAGASVYSATKAAVRSLARSFSADLLERGIRVNVISPGPIETPIFDRLGLPKEEASATKDAFASMVPLKRLGTPSEVAKTTAFLASSDSSFIVGQEILVDGGMNNL